MDDGREWEASLHSVPLVQAVLCADCEMISNSGGDACEVCGSRSLLSISRIMGGAIGEERAVLVPGSVGRLHNGFTVLVNPDAAGVLQQRRRRKQLAVGEQRSAKG